MHPAVLHLTTNNIPVITFGSQNKDIHNYLHSLNRKHEKL